MRAKSSKQRCPALCINSLVDLTCQHKHFSVFLHPELVETLFMARGQLLSLILAQQH